MRLHHVQLACPAGGEDEARRFWVGALGMVEVPKPAALAGRGGAWFRVVDDAGRVALEVHVGVEEPFAPARKAHPALVVDSAAHLRAVVARLELGGYYVDLSERHAVDGHERLHTRDGHGNRVEVLVAV